ncbi:MAG: hypothetical protein JRH11_01830 [Deltaproteobacteria bacterium]|nr:hypothetical protein [Deltaproteobacteria bacterium]
MTSARIVLVSMLATVAFACGAAQDTTEGPRADIHAPDHLYPLGIDYVWSYQVDNGIEDVLGVARVIAVIGPRIEISALGGEPFVYERREGGIYRPASSTWLLKAPITVGAEWEAPSGRTARVTSVSARIEVPAGEFEDCVRIEEDGGDDQKTVKTVYCPGIGPVYVETSMQLTLTEQPPRIIGRLMGCNLREQNEGTPCMDITAP